MATSNNFLSATNASGNSLKDNVIFEIGTNNLQNENTPAMNMSASRTAKVF
jgi:hypothetical protein